MITLYGHKLQAVDFDTPISVEEFDMMPVPEEIVYEGFSTRKFYRILNNHRTGIGLTRLHPVRILEITARRSVEELSRKGWYYENCGDNHNAFPGQLVSSYIRYYTEWKPARGGENLAMSLKPLTEEDLFQLWYNSPGHKALMESVLGHLVGVGCIRFRKKHWYALHVYEPFLSDEEQLIVPSE